MTAWAGAVVPAPVDALYPRHRIRARRLPGLVDFRKRQATAPSVSPNDDLLSVIEDVIAGRPDGIDILKVHALRPADGICEGCGGAMSAASIDAALGLNAGLVVEDLPGRWCEGCGTAVLADSGGELRLRLAAWLESGDSPEAHEPSFAYETPDHPRSVQLEISTRCNLACGYCTNRLLADTRDLSFEAFLAIADRMRWEALYNVDFTGLGEPTLNPDLPAMTREAARRAPRARIRLVSNAVASSVERLLELVDCGLTAIAFSIDTLDAERFAKARGGAALEKALRNVEGVARRRRDGDNGFGLRLKAVLIDEPYAEAEALLRYSAGLGMDMPHFSVLDSRSSAQSVYAERPDLHAAFADVRKSVDFMRWAEERWQELGGAPLLDDRAPVSGYISGRLREDRDVCRWAEDAAFIAIDGAALTCCETMMDIPRAAMADVAAGGLASAWRGEMLWRYRLPLSLGLLPKGCVGCAMAPRAHAR